MASTREGKLMHNLIQYGSLLVAIGCRLDYDTATTEFIITDFPKEDHKRKAVQEAVADIQKFLTTANYSDGAAAVALADYVDGNPNPLEDYLRTNILNSLGIKRGDKFISSVLMQAKVNRSWHTSEQEGVCTYFGEMCTHRGTNFDPKKRGIRSTRTPSEYHVASGATIKREQLITPALDAAYSLIPDSMLVSAKTIEVGANIEKQIEQLSPEKLDELLDKLTKRRETLSGTASS